ncbi:PP2C family protein-serine/threonine phosphatase [Streptomyces sp. NPDC006879]|uniref:PP2C family protein-serine/threonine phosphatase n=1 Tax=Streptomyces sp. NPDC006879 TaxID=3364767 RepID=UPI0036CC6A66
MRPRKERDEPGWMRGAPPPRWARIAPPAAVVVLSLAQALTPSYVELGFFLAAIPPVAAFSYGAAGTALLALLVLVLLLPAIGVGNAQGTDLFTVATVGLLSVVIAWVRRRRDAQLVSVRTIAEAAQMAVLAPLPDRVGPVRCSGLYRAAQRGTLVGGDLYDVKAGPYGVRALVADVQGHGLAAVGTVAALLGAFREGVLDDAGLGALATRLDRRLIEDSEGVEHPELFATAVLLEFPPGAGVVRIASCGHPPALLLREATAVEVGVDPAPPLGLGMVSLKPPPVIEVPLRAGDRILAYTDGVTESRDAAGVFYPLLERLPLLATSAAGRPRSARLAGAQGDGLAPGGLALALWHDLDHFSDGPKDDVALLVLSPDPVAP